MKLTFQSLKPRLKWSESKVDGILNYDSDNSYPQRILLMVDASGRATSCIETYAAFIEGGGFNDKTFWKAKINDNGLTNDKLLRYVSQDFANFRGFAIHVNYNANYRIDSLSFVPFEHPRLTIPDSKDYVGTIALYKDWARQRRSNIKKDEIQYINVFNPDPATIQLQVDRAGGWDKYKGQILWYSADGEYVYPKASIDPVLEDVDSDSQSKIFKNVNIRTGFNASHLLIRKGKPQTEEAAAEFDETLRQFQGAEKTSKIMVVDVEAEEQIPEIKPFETINKDKLYEFTESSVQESIRKRFKQPAILAGDLIAGKLGTAQEMVDAVNFYNGITEKERRVMEETFQMLFSYYKEPVNVTNDFSIIPLSIISIESGQLLVEKLQVGGTQAFTAIITDPVMLPQQKINTLILLFGMSSEDATGLVNGTPLASEELAPSPSTDTSS